MVSLQVCFETTALHPTALKAYLYVCMIPRRTTSTCVTSVPTRKVLFIRSLSKRLHHRESNKQICLNSADGHHCFRYQMKMFDPRNAARDGSCAGCYFFANILVVTSTQLVGSAQIGIIPPLDWTLVATGQAKAG